MIGRAGFIGRLWPLVRVGALVFALTLAGVLYGAHVMQRDHGEGRSLSAPVDALIILASGADPDRVLGFSSRRRVDLGVRLYHAGKARHLIMSGGLVRNTDLTLASMMRDHAIANGVPAEAILIEDRSRTTFENIRFSLDIAARQNLHRMAIATDNFHLLRARMLAWFFGASSIGLVAVEGIEAEGRHIRAFGYTRETLAWWYNGAKALGWWLLQSAGWSEGQRGALIH